MGVLKIGSSSTLLLCQCVILRAQELVLTSSVRRILGFQLKFDEHVLHDVATPHATSRKLHPQGVTQRRKVMYKGSEVVIASICTYSYC